MLNTVPRKKVQVLVLIAVLSAILVVSTALAVEHRIKARNGGTISIAPGVKLVVPAKALEEDTVISAEMVREPGQLSFIFGPGGTEFAEPAELKMNWQAISDIIDDGDEDLLENIGLYDENGKEIDVEPEIKSYGLVWHIPHFSLYYFRRR